MRYYKYLQFPPSLANIANIRQILEKAPSLAISWQIIPAEKILQIFPDNPICVAPFVWICAKLCSVQFEWRMFPSICIYSICAEVGGSNRRAPEWSNWKNVNFKSNLLELKQLAQHGQSCHLSYPVKDPICQNCEFEPKREIRSIHFVQLLLLVLIDESGDLERDLANWLDLGHKNIQRNLQIHFRTRN